jgi:hypothetical protein
MPEQAAATAATAPSSTVAQNVERLLLLLKSARGASCINLIQQALSTPGVYVFAEFLEAPNVQEVRSRIIKLTFIIIIITNSKTYNS